MLSFIDLLSASVLPAEARVPSSAWGQAAGRAEANIPGGEATYQLNLYHQDTFPLR